MAITDDGEQTDSLLSPDTLIGEETKGDIIAAESRPAESFSFKTPKGVNIEVRSLADVINTVPPEREWTIEGILPDCGLAIVGGRHKRGKSTLIIHASRSVEAGDTFLDRTTDKRPVVYVNYEMPTDYFVSLSNHPPVPNHFYVIERPEPKLTMVTIQAVIDAMKKREFKKGVMVIDSFRGAFRLRAEQENQSGEAGIILRDLQRIAITARWLILVIHHHKKSAEGEGSDNLSGTGDFGAAPDVIWSWSRPADPLKPGVLEVEGRIVPVDPMRVSLSPEECLYLGSVNGATEEDEKQRIDQALSNEKLTAKTLGEKTGIPYSTIKKRLDSMRTENRVDSEPGIGRGSPRLWFKPDCQISASDTQATQRSEQEPVLKA
jgi:AAA domain-containing protein